jgi:hypothetical protein
MARSEVRIRVSAQDRATSTLKRITGGIIALAGAYLSIHGIRSIIRTIGDFTQAAARQEKVVAKLTQQLKNHNELTKENLNALKDQASALQKVTQFGDEQILAGQAMLASFSLTTEQIKEMTPRMLDAAVMNERLTGTQTDLSTIAKMVGVALGGQAGRLVQMGIKMTDTQRRTYQAASEQEKFNLLLEIFDQNAKGLAKSVGTTWAGSMSKMQNQLGDSKELLGAIITESGAWKQVLAIITETISDLNTWLQKNQKTVKEWAFTAAIYTVEVARQIGDSFVSMKWALVEVQKGWQNLVKVWSYTQINGADIRQDIAATIDKLNEQSTEVMVTRAKWNEWIDDVENKVIAANQELALSISDGTSASIAGAVQEVTKATEKMNEVFDSTAEPSKRGAIKDMTGEIGELGKQAYSFAESWGTRFVDDIMMARKSFNQFASDFLKQMARMIAKMLIMKALKTAFGVSTGGIGFLFAQHGRMIPDIGPYGDRWPVMAERGERVLSRREYGAMGGEAGVRQAINNTNNFQPTLNVTVNGTADGEQIARAGVDELRKLHWRRIATQS